MRETDSPSPSWRQQCVRKRAEYVRIQKFGRRIATEHFVFVVRVRETDDPGPKDTESCRLGITVSARFGNAVRRNRAKRLIREAFRALRSVLPPRSDLVVIGKKDDVNLNLAQVISEWKSAFLARSRVPGRGTASARRHTGDGSR